MEVDGRAATAESLTTTQENDLRVVRTDPTKWVRNRCHQPTRVFGYITVGAVLLMVLCIVISTSSSSTASHPQSPSPPPKPPWAPGGVPSPPQMGGNETHVLLNNGLWMPRLAFAANVWDASTCTSATVAALDAGFRFVWSSVLVNEPCQLAQRAAIDSHPTVHRSNIYLAGTVDTAGCPSEDACRTATMAGAREQMSRLGPEKLDQIMLDYPATRFMTEATWDSCGPIRGQWAAFTELYTAKEVKSIAVSNFGPTELECLIGSGAPAGAIIPVVNQLRFAVGHTSGVDLDLNKQHGIVVQAYSPLAAGSVLSDPKLASIGAAHTPTRSAAQVAYRYILQRNVTIATQSTNPAHLQEDVEIFGWRLTDAEMAQLGE